jgi:hypothetical protein
MTIKLPASVINFAAGDTTLYENFTDYWNHFRSQNSDKQYPYTKTDKDGKSITFAQKEEALNAMLIREISKRSGVDLTSIPLEQAAGHPLVSWAAGNIVSQMIDAILPATMVEGTSMYADIRSVGFGESAVFNIKSRDLFPVTKVGHLGMRTAEMHKGYERQVTLYPEMRQITVGVSLFRVLSGLESLADFTVKSMLSINTELTRDIYTAFATSMAALSDDATTGLRLTGYTQLAMTQLAQKVSGFMGNAKVVVLGSKAALSYILPDDTNTRAYYDSDYVKVGYVRTISGLDTFEIPQVPDWKNPFATFVADDKVYLVAPGTDKIVKCVLGGSTISNVDSQFSNADLRQDATFYKSWATGVITSSLAGTIEVA